MTSITEKEFYHLAVSINKALNPMEAPLKMKHARSIIITTHRTKEAKSFWMQVTRHSLMEHRFTAWKFCHLLHKVLREGHESTIKSSQTHKKLIIEMGRLWGHLQDGVGNCIQAYSKLIVTKLEFHEKNAIFPGTLLIDIRTIEKYAADDINVYFQLCVEIFDYLDDIIDIQSKIFASINTYRMSSMSCQGQCRLAPLITLIQDSNPLYDLCVRFMFKLHNELSSDILMGHRDRFRDLFHKLKYFYDNVRPLQYFADLIQVPNLPESAPNFTSKVDFGSYIPPVVFVQPDPEPQMDNLVDTESAIEQSKQTHAAEQTDKIMTLERTVQDREVFIQRLENELTTTKQHLNLMENNYNRDINQLRNEITVLNNELAVSKDLNRNIQSINEDLESKLANTPSLMLKVSEEEEKAKSLEAKFIKLKTMYNQIRDEHIKLLRQHDDVNKSLNKANQINIDLSTEIDQLKNNFQSFEEELKIKDEVSNQNSLLEDKLQEITTKHQILISSTEKQNKEYNDIIIKKNIEIKKLTANVKECEENILKLEEKESVSYGQNSKLETKLKEITEKNENLCILNEKQKQDYDQIVTNKGIENDDLYVQLKTSQAQISALEQHKLEYIKSLELLTETTTKLHSENDSKADIIMTYKSDLEKKLRDTEVMQQNYDTEIEMKNKVINQIQERFSLMEIELKNKTTAITSLTDKNTTFERIVSDLHQKTHELYNQVTATREEVNSIADSKKNCIIKYENMIKSLFQSILKTIREISDSKLNEKNLQSFEKSLKLLKDMDEGLIDYELKYFEHSDDHKAIEKLSQQSILVGYVFVMLHEQCILVYNTAMDIEIAQNVFNLINSIGEKFLKLIELVCKRENSEVIKQNITVIKQEISEIVKLIKKLIEQSTTNVGLEKLVENELEEMDKAIEEAADRFVRMLSEARSKDIGIKLEVNEKILDSCSALMNNIKILIQKSRILQEEIISTGRGNTSVKEFYKRNSQWTEGLISASKSVAKGANLLVEAANKAVTNESNKNFEIIAAAQEIAACTAQLVIASKVKASRESGKLSDLTRASRNVSQATGAVVATVKDCNVHLEQFQDFDIAKLTSSQVKTMEMEIHVKILELEQALQSQRLKLASFRKNHYQTNDD